MFSINQLLGIAPDASEHGVFIDQMLEFLNWKMLILFAGWSLYLIYVLFRFHRSRHPRASYEGAKTKITTHIEVSVIILEAILLLGFAFPLWARRVNDFPKQGALRVRVVAEQFLWNYQYPGPDGKFGRAAMRNITASNPMGIDWSDPAAQDDFTTRNEMHIPLKKPVIVELSSKDVIHDFSVPNLRMAQDAIPGQMIPIWFTPVKTGEFEVVCAQLCGSGHAKMRGVVVVDEQKDFDSWAANKQANENRVAPNAPAAKPVEPVSNLEGAAQPDATQPVPQALPRGGSAGEGRPPDIPPAPVAGEHPAQ